MTGESFELMIYLYIYSVRDVTIPAHGKGFADTDLAIAVPAGTCQCSFFPSSISITLLPIFVSIGDPTRP